MNISIPRKIGRLIGDLATHPRYVQRYVRHNVLNGKFPLDLEIPWFPYAAIDFLEGYLRPHMEVCEYGSGGSTLFFARRVRSVFSVENNPEWMEMVTRRLQKRHISNVTMKLRPFDFKNPVGFEQSEYLHAIPDKKYDVIVVDGTEEWTPIRPLCFRHVEDRIKPGGIILVDDSWRYPELRQENKAKRFEILQSVGPCRPGVTSTDVFYY